MTKVNTHEIGLVFGGLLAIWHAIWAAMVLLGIAQTYITWILGLHFIKVELSINAFSLGNAALLVVVTGVIGYIMGNILGWLWNLAHKKSHSSK